MQFFLTFKTEDGKEIKMTLPEAQEIYEFLNRVFKDVNPAIMNNSTSTS